jgi:folate-binding protein YgfZ
MSATALQEKMQESLHATGIGEYRGATTAAKFSGPQPELAAMHLGCAIYDLGFRNQISVTGGDRTRWLNGMITNNVRDLAKGHGVYAFLLNPQGKIQGDMYVYNRGESITIDTDRSQVEKMLAIFDHYIIMDDVELKNLSASITALGVSGAKSREVLAAAGLKVPELQPLQLLDIDCDCDCGCVKCTILRTDSATESYEIWLAADHVEALWNTLLKAGATPAGSDALEMQRIISGVPQYGVDIRERDLPQETEQARALNFNKGCYVGQEIVERIRSRGNVHRKFAGFITEGHSVISPGAKILDAEKEVGEVTSSASLKLGENEKTIALGYIRREVGVPGREITINGNRATVVQVPLDVTGIFTERTLVHQ